MIITDYYKFTRLEGKSKTRLDCTLSTHSYPKFEAMRNNAGELFVYCTANRHTEAGRNMMASLALVKTEHISSIFIPDATKHLGVGDMRGTADALLFMFDKVTAGDEGCNIFIHSSIEVFVCRGYKRNCYNLYTLLSDDELSTEIERIRELSTSDFIPK